MKKYLLIPFLMIQFIYANHQSLQFEKIPNIMDKFFQYHVEAKGFTPTVVRRSFKLYIENFDPDKVYLLQEEILPFLHLSDRRAQNIVARVKRGDFSDYIELNQVLQKAVLRSRAWREGLAKQCMEEGCSIAKSSTFPHYGKSEQELKNRQKARMSRFFGYHLKKSSSGASERKEKIMALFSKKLNRFENGYLFLNSYSEALSEKQIEHQMSVRILKSLAKSLDAHTAFFSEEEAHEMRTSLEKQFQGVGVVLSEGIDGVQIADVIKGSPAELSGKIQVDDLIVEIDGENIEQISFEEVLEKMKSRGNSDIVLGLKRLSASGSGEKFWRVPLERKAIVMEEGRLSYSYEPFGNGYIGKITLHSFYENGNGINSEKDLKAAIQDLKSKGPLLGIVLDLRENAGGFLSQAVKVAGLFISNGVVVISKYSDGKMQYLRNIDGQVQFDGPVIVLTSKISASAAEIVAQALQDYGVALVVGDERTFGKGSIQFQTVTDANADLFFKITVGKYYTVSGKSTQIEGVQADMVVPTIFSPFAVGERYLEYPLPADQVAAAYQDPLTDLEGRIKVWFQYNYLPTLQKKVSKWRAMLPELKKNSAGRMGKDKNFQAFLKKQKELETKPTAVIIQEQAQYRGHGVEDLQMQEAVEIVKDMVQMDGEKTLEGQASQRESILPGLSLENEAA